MTAADPAAAAPGSRPAVLAIDGGNSKTDVIMVAADGTVLSSVRGPGTAWQRDGVTETLTVLGDLVRRAAGQAGRSAGDGSPAGPFAVHMSACLANVDLPEEEDEVCQALRAQRWSLSTSIANDTFAVLRAGTPSPEHGEGGSWGVAVTCGAGINCVGLAPDGRSTRYLALGDISGDWGGGGDLGREALWWAVRAEDGRGEPTALRAAVASHFGVGTVREVTIGLHKGLISAGELLGLTSVLFAAAQRSDPVARRLVDRQAGEISLMALVAMRRLGLTGLATPVVLGGGLLTAREPLLLGGIEDRIAREAPRATIQVIDVPPVAGAALLGLDQVQASPAAHDRLRAAYAVAARDASTHRRPQPLARPLATPLRRFPPGRLC